MSNPNRWLNGVTLVAARPPAPFDVSYVRHVEPLRILRSTPRRLRSLLRALLLPDAIEDAAALTQVRLLVLGRIAEAELLFAFRLRQAASGRHRAADPLHGDGWSLPPMFARADEAMVLFTRLRRWNLRFIRSTSTRPGVEQTATTPSAAVRAVVEAMAHHDITRLEHIASLQ